MKVCADCGNFLEESTITGTLQYKCSCGRIWDGEEEDSLIRSEQKIDDNSFRRFRKLIVQSPFHPSIPKVAVPCGKCKNPVVSYGRLGDEEKRYFSCICGNIFD